jgi:putative endonuclease
VAHRLLERVRWTIREHVYRLGRREIDIIASRTSVLAFVEVKTRPKGEMGSPEDAVTSKKRREIEVVPRDHLMRHPPEDVGVRFDVVAIVADERRHILRCDHIEDADALNPDPSARDDSLDGSQEVPADRLGDRAYLLHHPRELLRV